MAAITVLKGNNVPYGPYTRAEIGEQLSRGEITLTSLAFVEGLAEWTPLRDVLAKVDAANPPPVVAAPPASTVPIGTGYAQAGPVSAGASAPIGTGYSYAVTMQPPEHLVYAGFWLRFAAIFVDALILLPLSLISVGFTYADDVATDNNVKLAIAVVSLVYSLFLIVAQWLYFALQESSAAQATLGKRLLGLQVTDRVGGRIGFGRATGRYFGKLISALALYIGFMMAGWTQRKQALHDMMADTLVVRKPRL
jgi:uncharacterized RDD family membrane protein YckC